MAGLSGFGSYMRKQGKKKGKAEGMAAGMTEGMKQGEMSAAQMIAKRKDEAARRARGVM
jgi:flagellar biosynthesis/type III secretory pathway protein FliH